MRTACIQLKSNNVQIRASSLSGECSVLSEMMRGRMQLTKGLPECAKRRATLSLQANPVCRGVAAQAVEQAFEKCFNDWAPFDKNDILKG